MLALRGSAHRRVSAAFAAAIVLGLAACSSGPDTDFGDNDPNLVVAIGDSITFGKHDMGIESCAHSYRESLGFCPRLEALTGKTVINEGECGERSTAGVEKIDEILARYHPGVILIDYSPNDIVDGSEVTIENLRTMIATARANKTVPILGTVTPAVGDHDGWEPFILDLNAKILALCAEENVACADHHQAFMDDPGFIASPYTLLDDDGLHPIGPGYALMAETWREPLMRLY